jgi:ankyrin repeat protein
LARHGETENVKLLLDHGACCSPAIEYIPDFKGYLPLDFSGMFQHDDVTEILIDIMYKHILSAVSSKIEPK